MNTFMIQFLLCNLFISVIICFIVLVKKLFINILSPRMQYNIWFPLFGLLVMPFIPFQINGLSGISSLFGILLTYENPVNEIFKSNHTSANQIHTSNWMNDFTASVNRKSSFPIGYILFGIWITGMIIVLIITLNSLLHLYTLKSSSLPLQNKRVWNVYRRCLQELNIKKEVPIYSTAFLKSPVIVGLFKPCIFLPLHLISNFDENESRYMLLHELQHYRHKDNFFNYATSLAVAIYWFNPFMWYVLRQINIDREIACDSSVLNILKEDTYADYGNTLISFAEKIALFPFPFGAGIGGNVKQLEKRIISIASYKKPTFCKLIKGYAVFLIISLVILCFAPLISTYACDSDYYKITDSAENISYVDLSGYFGKYNGCFVLYNEKENTWNIHNMEQASLRVSPNSTYKIYDALFALDSNIITPDNSNMKWNGNFYSFEAWNTDQTLQSAIESSVNWYFEALDKKMGASCINKYIQSINYGNENIHSDFPDYWLESSLKISPIEQVELLVKLKNNRLEFSHENINAVKNAILISSTNNGTLYGKTGTGRVNGQDVNGWFIGFVETDNNTYFFATNIKSEDKATGRTASQITLSILSDINIKTF